MSRMQLLCDKAYGNSKMKELLSSTHGFRPGRY